MVELFKPVRHLDPHCAVILVVALTIAFGFELRTRNSKSTENVDPHNGLRKRASSTRARIPPSWISQSRPIWALSAPWTRRA